MSIKGYQILVIAGFLVGFGNQGMPEDVPRHAQLMALSNLQLPSA